MSDISACLRAEGQELFEHLFDRVLVGIDLFQGENLAAFVLAGGIADAGGAAAHQRDRLAAGFLQPVQHHDRQERADVQRGRGAVEADIGGELPSRRLLVETGEVGALMNEPARGEHLEKVGCRAEGFGHGHLRD